jgi:hypothetical protein
MEDKDIERLLASFSKCLLLSPNLLCPLERTMLVSREAHSGNTDF